MLKDAPCSVCCPFICTTTKFSISFHPHILFNNPFLFTPIVEIEAHGKNVIFWYHWVFLIWKLCFSYFSILQFFLFSLPYFHSILINRPEFLYWKINWSNNMSNWFLFMFTNHHQCLMLLLSFLFFFIFSSSIIQLSTFIKSARCYIQCTELTKKVFPVKYEMSTSETFSTKRQDFRFSKWPPSITGPVGEEIAKVVPVCAYTLCRYKTSKRKWWKTAVINTIQYDKRCAISNL